MQLRRRKSCSTRLLLVISYLLLVAPLVHAESSVLDLNSKIQAKKQAQSELQKKMAKYQEQIRASQKKAASLANQINILESNIAKTELEIETKALEAEQLALEIQLVNTQIEEEEGRIDTTLGDIGKVLREIKKYDDRNYVEVVLAEDSFSKVFDQLFYSERFAYNLRRKLDNLQSIRATLGENQKTLEDKKTEAEQKKQGLAVMQSSFEQEKRAKEGLFGKTKSTEAEFQALLSELRRAASAIDSDIVTLEKSIREKLDIADKLAGDTGLLSWPASPIGGISAAFHDPDYPFRYIFEHNGIDIRTPQGTPVRAAASGYVAKAFSGGYGVSPSYIMLLHGNQLTTVYMHVSSIVVSPNTYVARGDIIGYSGGTPRTAGAGRWTTGPHLHFETRLNGVPVNPVGYLP